MLRELIGNPQQIPAAVGVGKGADAQAVGGVQLLLQELAAHLLDLLHLQQARCTGTTSQVYARFFLLIYIFPPYIFKISIYHWIFIKILYETYFFKC